MADDQDPSNDVNENENENENDDRMDYYDEDGTSASTTTTLSSSTVQNSSASLVDNDYDDEPIEDYVVNLVVNEKPDGGLTNDLVNAAVTDEYGNRIYDSINGVTTSLYDELNGNSTAITGGKRWFGWSTTKLLFTGLIALCILGILLAAIFFVISKKFKKNPRTPAAPGSTATTKAAVTKGISPDPKYQPVPNV